jgi:hypothetical protein
VKLELSLDHALELGATQGAISQEEDEKMLQKTLIRLTAIAAALGAGSTAMAAHINGGGRANIGGGGGSAMSMARGPVGGPGLGAMNAPLGAGPGRMTTFNRADPMTNGPTFNRAPINGPIGRTGGNWANNNWHHDHFHHRFHNRNFFAFGFDGGPYYDYAYNSCWAQVPTYYGLQWVYVCGDYYGY